MTAHSRDQWTDYFTNNQTRLLHIDWGDTYELTAVEQIAITSSVQQFQLGEQSEGKRLIQLAKQYANRTGDTDYLQALHLFIAEEQRHAHDLGRFMDQQHIARLEAHPVDSVFRWLRRLINLEVAIVVLLSAEVIACTFYKALYDATGSKTLRDLCRQILRDEIKHLKFQASTLKKIRSGRPRLFYWLTRWLERFFFAGVLLLVWYEHHRVYRAGGFTFTQYWQANWKRHYQTFAYSL